MNHAPGRPAFETCAGRFRAFVAAVSTAGLLLAVGCQKKPQEKDPNQPLLTSLVLDGTARENSRVLLFSMNFRDADHDLAAGTYTPLINQKPSVAQPLPLSTLFLQNNLSPDTPEGRLEFELEVKIPDDDRPASGSTFDVGIQAQDGAGHLSNIPTVTVEISY